MSRTKKQMKFLEFDQMNPMKLAKTVLKKVESNKNEILNLIKEKNHSYQTLIKPIEELNDSLLNEFTRLAHLNAVKNSENTETEYQKCNIQLTEYFTFLSQNEVLYKYYKRIQKKEKIALNEEQRKVLQNSIRDFELEGVALKKAMKDRLAEINIRLSELSNQFSKNLLAATQNFELIITDKKDVKGIPDADLKAAQFKQGRKNAWKFTLQMPSYLTYMTYGPNRQLRRKIEQAYVTRAPENGAIIEEILKLRHEKASILGFENYAEYSLATKIAQSSDEVLTFLEDLVARGMDYAKKEMNQLRAFARKNGLNTTFTGYDRLYYSEKLKKKTFSFDEEKYRPYFAKESVVNGLMNFIENLFSLQFKPVKAAVWDDSVLTYELVKDGRSIARLYLDLESRPDKRGGAWLHNWQTHHINARGEESPASAFIVANFPPASKNQPSLLRPTDVMTLFHEMGHALQHLCSNVAEISISGIAGIEWDAVEFPSQFLENFAYDADVLKLFAKHYKTGKVLPDRMIERLVASKNFLSGVLLMRQLEFALFDMKIHQRDYSEEEVQAILNRIRIAVGLLSTPGYNRFQHGFSHIFVGGYAAGYYSYKWAESLSADAFLTFKDRGIFDVELSESYYKHILQRGGSENAMVLFEKFIGRKPDLDALLRLHGMGGKIEDIEINLFVERCIEPVEV